MGAAAETFLQLRAEEFVTMFDPSFTKKEAEKTGIELVQNMANEGNVEKVDFIANLARLNAVVGSAMTEARKHLPLDKTTALGVEFNPVLGGSVCNNSEDPIWVALKADLDARTELIKLAQKQDVFDAYGNQVPKVGTTPRASSVTIKF